MLQLLGQAIFIFCKGLEYLIFAYVILSWLPKLKGFKLVVAHILDPLFSIIRLLMKHSVFRTNQLDLTPLVALLIVTFIQTILL
ncbi:MAG: YggT family protein [bacterium]|nr:YggT family protein [bacterium]